MSRPASIAVTMGAALALSHAALAAPILCGPRTALLTKLATDLHEEPSSVGLTGDGQLLEVLTSDERLTWSILVTDPRGISCLVANGRGWQGKQAPPVVQDPQT